MLIQNRLLYALFLASLFLGACKKSPKVIESKNSGVKSIAKSESFFEWSNESKQNKTPANFKDEVHQVIVKESLEASRYVYLKVQEAGEEFWIATRKEKFNVGEQYFYRGGLLKKDFHSKEYDRTFDRITLVSKLVPEKHGGNELVKPVPVESHSEFSSKGSIPVAQAKNKIQKPGSLPIAELIKNPKAYEGQTIQISGNCIKINPNIMGRNWLHIKDGSADDFDLVVTTISQVKEGQALTMKAKVVLNKDFGAGYTYDLILEEGVIVPGA